MWNAKNRRKQGKGKQSSRQPAAAGSNNNTTTTTTTTPKAAAAPVAYTKRYGSSQLQFFLVLSLCFFACISSLFCMSFILSFGSCPWASCSFVCFGRICILVAAALHFQHKKNSEKVCPAVFVDPKIVLHPYKNQYNSILVKKFWPKQKIQILIVGSRRHIFVCPGEWLVLVRTSNGTATRDAVTRG